MRTKVYHLRPIGPHPVPIEVAVQAAKDDCPEWVKVENHSVYIRLIMPENKTVNDLSLDDLRSRGWGVGVSYIHQTKDHK